MTKPKHTKNQKEVKVDPSVAKMEKLMDMRLDGIAWFLAEHPIKENEK
jgi:hypothetical protein